MCHKESCGGWERRMKRWHKYFCLFPVCDYNTGTTLWLETVERRLVEADWYTGSHD